MSLIGAGFRWWSFSRPRRTVVTRLAASSTARCLLTDCRAMSSPAHSSRSVCPLWAFRLSSSLRRLGSASALNTSSITHPWHRRKRQPSGCLLTLGSQMAACQHLLELCWPALARPGGLRVGADDAEGGGALRTGGSQA